MTAIRNAVRAEDENVSKLMTSSPMNVLCLLRRLTCKELEPLQNVAKLLGLHVSGNGERLRWRRGGEAPQVPLVITRWRTFSVGGKLVGHFPVCGWLRVTVADIKRCVTSVSSGWDDEMREATLRSMLTKTVARVTRDDPVDGNEFTVWVDAMELRSRLTMPSWKILVGFDRKMMQNLHLAELDATLKGVKLAIQWQAKGVHIVTDSACTYRWITDALTGKARLTTKASSEMLIRRRLATMAETIKEYNLVVDLAPIRSAMNKADALTRVPQRWLTSARKGSEPLQQSCAAIALRLDSERILSIHLQCRHPGIKRTLYLTRMVKLAVDKVDVKMAVKKCEAYQSIDPASAQWKKGQLGTCNT